VGLEVLSFGGDGAIGQGSVLQQIFKHPDQSGLVVVATQAQLMFHFKVASRMLHR